MTEMGIDNSSHVINHLTDDIFHWCSSSNTGWDPQIFFCKYSNGLLKEPFPDELICLRHCWDCVHEYHKERQTYVELNQDLTEWVLFSFECTVLRDSLEDVKQELEKKQTGNKYKNAKKTSAPNFIDQAQHLPIVLQEILKHPYFFFMKDVHDLFIEVLHKVFTLYGKNQNIPQFPGIYLLLVHPDQQVRKWAEQKVTEFDPIQLADSSDLLQVVNIVFSVLKFGFQDDPSICDGVTMDEPSRRVIISSYQFNKDVYWQGLHNLLNHMDSELVHSIKEEIPQNILNSVLKAAQSDDPENSFFLLKLSCFVVLLRSSREAFWLKVQDHQDDVFISVIQCRFWKSLLEKISRKSTANPADLCAHFNWVLPWANSLSGSQGARATDLDYSISYVYHLQGFIQHRHYHNLPNSLPHSMCQGTHKCKFHEMKKSRGNKLNTSVLPEPTVSQKEAQQVINDILKQLYACRKSLHKQFSSKGMKRDMAGFLLYKDIWRLVLTMYKRNSPRASVCHIVEDEIGSDSDPEGYQQSDSDEMKTLDHSQRISGRLQGESDTTPLNLKLPKVVLSRKPITILSGPDSSEAANSGTSDLSRLKSKSHFKFKSKSHIMCLESASPLEVSNEERAKGPQLSAPSATIKLVDVGKCFPHPQEQTEGADNVQNIFNIMNKVKKETTFTSKSPAETKEGPPSAIEETSNGPWRKVTGVFLDSHSSTRVLLDEEGKPVDCKTLTPKIRPCSVRLSRIKHPKRTPKRTLECDSDSDSSDFVGFKKRSKRLPSDDESSGIEMTPAVDSGKDSCKDQMHRKEQHSSSNTHNSRLQHSSQSDSDWDPPDVFRDDLSVGVWKKTGEGEGERGHKSTVSVRKKECNSEMAEDEIISISSSDDEGEDEIRRTRLKKKSVVVVVSDGEQESSFERSLIKCKEVHLDPSKVIKATTVKDKMFMENTLKVDSEKMETNESIERAEDVDAKMKLETGIYNRTDFEEVEVKRGAHKERTDYKGTRRKGKCDSNNCKACQGLGGKHVIQNFGREEPEGRKRDEEKHNGMERLSPLVRTSQGVTDQNGEEYFGREKNLREDKYEKDRKIRLDSRDGNDGEKDGKTNNFLTKYTILFNDEESCMDSDAETDDGGTSDDKDESVPSPAFDFQEDLIDQMEDEPTLTQLDRIKPEVKVEEDGNISDGLDLDEIIDITESMTQSEAVEVEDGRVTQEKEEFATSYADLWNDSSSDVPLVISELPVTVEPPAEDETKDSCDEGNAVVDKHAQIMQEKVRAGNEEGVTQLKESVEEAGKCENILLGFLEGGSTEEDEGDEDDGWVDENSRWVVGDDGWLEGNDEGEQDAVEDGEIEGGEIEENISIHSQGFQISETNTHTTTSAAHRVPTGVAEIKEGISHKSQVGEGKDKQKRRSYQTVGLGQVSKQPEKDSVKARHGFHSKSFYRHRMQNKIPPRNKMPSKKTDQAKQKAKYYAAVKKMMAEKRVSDAAVPLGNKSLVTGQIVRGKGDQPLGTPQRSVNEPTIPTVENGDTRLAPPIKSSAYRSKRSKSLLESLKQAETQNTTKPRWAASKGLSASMSQVGTKNSEKSCALSESFTAGVTNRETENQRNKTGAPRNVDLVSSIMEETTQTFQGMRIKRSLSAPTAKTSSSSYECQQERHSGEPHERKGNAPKQTVPLAATRSRQHPTSENSGEKDRRSNPGRKVHFADAVSFAPAHSSNVSNRRSVLKNRYTQNIHPRPIISYDKVDIETSYERHRSFVRHFSDPAKTTYEFSSTVDKQQPNLFETSGKQAPMLSPTKPLMVDQFIGWILGWKVGHMEEKIDDLGKILKGCDTFNTLKEVPNSFSSVDEFYATFIPLKMIQIWEELHNVYAKIGNDRTSVATLSVSRQSKFHEQPYKICDFKVSLPESSQKSKPGSILHPRRWDLVIIGPESSYSFVPVFGYVEEAQFSQSAGFYSRNNSKELLLSIRVLGDVDFNAHCVKLQVMTSLSSYIHQFQAFKSLEKSALSSNILSPTRRDVFGEGQSPSVIDKLLKDILAHQQRTHRAGHVKPSCMTKEQEKFIKTTFHCIQQSYAVPRICMLQGPPCSGKTSALIHLVTCLLLHSSYESDAPQTSISQASKPKILLCAPSDTAVDVMTRQLWKMLRHFRVEGNRHNTPESLPYFILRLGDVRDVNKKFKKFVLEEIIGSQKARAEHFAKEWNKRIGQLQMQEHSVESTIQHRKFLIKKLGQIEKLQKEKMKLREERKKLEAQLMEQKESFNLELIKQDAMSKADVILCKLSDISSPELQKLLRLQQTDPHLLRFSCAIIDEACQGLEVDTLLPLYSGITKLVLAGDPHELKADPFRLIPSKFKLTQSLFTRLWMNFQGSPHQPVMTLTEQHACHPQIYRFPNKTFYNNRIKNERTDSVNTKIPLMPYLVYNVTTGGQEASNTGGWSNETELELIQCIVDIINQQKLPEIGLAFISPYPEQSKKIRERISIPQGWYVGDVDGLQGRMKDIVIISCVRTEVMSSNDSSFLHNHSKLNVALTRACYSVFVIGNFTVLPKINTLWSNLLKDASQRELKIDVIRTDFIKKLGQTCLVKGYQNFQAKIIQRKQNASPHSSSSYS